MESVPRSSHLQRWMRLQQEKSLEVINSTDNMIEKIVVFNLPYDFYIINRIMQTKLLAEKRGNLANLLDALEFSQSFSFAEVTADLSNDRANKNLGNFVAVNVIRNVRTEWNQIQLLETVCSNNWKLPKDLESFYNALIQGPLVTGRLQYKTVKEKSEFETRVLVKPITMTETFVLHKKSQRLVNLLQRFSQFKAQISSMRPRSALLSEYKGLLKSMCAITKLNYTHLYKEYIEWFNFSKALREKCNDRRALIW